ncbi:hypothetical protein FACS1894110_11260 [Spirochaetia bacterium]|nr:hypothetical protein FACS1894110_11260 [Spirochaetia bacterium]
MKRLSMFLFVLLLIGAFCFAQTGTAPGQAPAQRPPIPAPARPPVAAPQNTPAPAAPKAAPKKKNLDLEISLGVPVHFTNDIEKPSENNAAVAIGIGLTYNFNKWVAIGLEGDFAYAQNTSAISIDPDNKSNYYSIFNANVLLGPVFYLYSDEHFKIPLAVDFHFGFNRSDFSQIQTDRTVDPISQSVFLLGPALQIGVQYHFSKDFYILSRAMVTCDVVSFGANTSTGDVKTDRPEMGITWGVKPLLGVGLRL